MRTLAVGSRLPAPLGEVLIFAITVAATVGAWRVFQGPVTCEAWVNALWLGVALGWVDSYRRARARAPFATGRSA
jgi:hypothetical protein